MLQQKEIALKEILINKDRNKIFISCYTFSIHFTNINVLQLHISLQIKNIYESLNVKIV